jgi:hypothetical protein
MLNMLHIIYVITVKNKYIDILWYAKRFVKNIDLSLYIIIDIGDDLKSRKKLNNLNPIKMQILL